MLLLLLGFYRISVVVAPPRRCYFSSSATIGTAEAPNRQAVPSPSVALAVVARRLRNNFELNNCLRSEVCVAIIAQEDGGKKDAGKGEFKVREEENDALILIIDRAIPTPTTTTTDDDARSRRVRFRTPRTYTIVGCRPRSRGDAERRRGRRRFGRIRGAVESTGIIEPKRE